MQDALKQMRRRWTGPLLLQMLEMERARRSGRSMQGLALQGPRLAHRLRRERYMVAEGETNRRRLQRAEALHPARQSRVSAVPVWLRARRDRPAGESDSRACAPLRRVACAFPERRYTDGW